MNKDLEHLRVLAIFHYVVGGLAALFACIPVIHLVVGIAMVTGRFDADTGGPGEAMMLGWFIILFAAAFILAGWTFALCLILAGRSLSRRKHYTFCLVMAGLACMFMPFGTVLGVFTIIVLVRDSVKKLFSPSGGPPAQAG